MSKKVAFIAGSFDPIHFGHVYLIEQGLRIFDEVIVLVADNPDKKHLFSLEERLDLVHTTIGDTFNHFERSSIRVYTAAHDEPTIVRAKRLGATTYIRGLRNSEDFNYEMKLLDGNKRIDPSVRTIFFPTPNYLKDVSSSGIKEFMRLKCSDVVKLMATEYVLDSLRDKYNV
jgi:pantetheine-phosphate adenylyltransferase